MKTKIIFHLWHAYTHSIPIDKHDNVACDNVCESFGTTILIHIL